MQKYLSKSRMDKISVKLVAVTLIVIFSMSVYGAYSLYNQAPNQGGTSDVLGLQFAHELGTPLTIAVLVTSHLDPILNGELTISNGKVKPLDEDLKYAVISGRTLEVFTLLQSTGSEFGVREVMRELEYSSPNLAYYHLNKLYNLGYVDKNDQNKYSVRQEVVETIYPQNSDKTQEIAKLNQINLLIFIALAILSLLAIVFLIFGVSGKVWALTITPLLLLTTLGFAKLNNYSIRVK